MDQDNQGNILVVDSTQRVRKINKSNGMYTTVNTLIGTGGVGNLDSPAKHFLTSNGDLFVTQ